MVLCFLVYFLPYQDHLNFLSTKRLLIPIDGLRFGLGNPHPLSGNMPSLPSLGWRQVKNGRLSLTTTEVPPSSDWCSKQEIQAVAATIQRLFRRQQNRNQFDE